MSHTEANRKGSFLERRIAKLFSKIGFETKLNSKEMGFETDVLARKNGFTIIIEAKQYESYINVKSLLHEWSSKGKSVGVGRTLLVVTGLKNISESDRALAKKLGIYLWDEEVIHNLHDIENREELYNEIGKRLEFIDVIKKLEERAKKVMLIRLTSIIIVFLVIFFLFKFYVGNMNPTHQLNIPDNNSEDLSVQKEESNAESIVIENRSQNQQEILKKEDPKEILISFCNSEFNKGSSSAQITDTHYFEDYDIAERWIENFMLDYSEDLRDTIEKNQNSVERYAQEKICLYRHTILNKADFPLVVIQGRVNHPEPMKKDWIYSCDKSGILKSELPSGTYKIPCDGFELTLIS